MYVCACVYQSRRMHVYTFFSLAFYVCACVKHVIQVIYIVVFMLKQQHALQPFVRFQMHMPHPYAEYARTFAAPPATVKPARREASVTEGGSGRWRVLRIPV